MYIDFFVLFFFSSFKKYTMYVTCISTNNVNLKIHVGTNRALKRSQYFFLSEF